MHSDRSIAIGRTFGVRATDVFVATYPKCGTTWVTAICHALRTRGLAKYQTFEEITEVCPWDILATDCGQNLDADHVAEPRIFKSHEAWDAIAKGGKYIYVCRNPADALLSFYHFLPRYLHCPEVSIEAFAKAIFSDLSHSRTIWSHLVGWIRAALQHPNDILVLTYEDLKTHSKREIKRIADFLNIHDADLHKIHELTSFEHMKRHESQFDDHFVFDKLKVRMGLDGLPHATTKVHNGTAGRGKFDLPSSVLDVLDRQWDKLVRSTLKVRSYDELVHSIIHAQLHVQTNSRQDKDDDFLVNATFHWAKGQTLDPYARSLGSGHGLNGQKQLLSNIICPDGIGASEALNIFKKTIAPTLRSNAHPFNLAYIGSAPTVAAIAADWMITAACQNGAFEAAGQGLVEAERLTLQWIADLAGFPEETACGVFVSGATIGTLSALYAARAKHKRTMAEKNPSVQLNTSRRLKIVTSRIAHSSVHLAAKVLDVDLILLGSDASENEDWSDTLKEILGRDVGDIFAVVASAGATNTGAVDNIGNLVAVCRQFEIWLHVDGAYGLGALVAPSKRHLFDGLEHADSFVVDPHKMLFTPYDCSALIYRDGDDARIAHMQSAAYLDTFDRLEYNPADYAIHLSRRPRGFALWFSLAVYGTRRYERDIEAVFACCAQVVDFIRQAPHLELAREPTLPIVLFRKIGMDNREDMLAWCQDKWEASELFCQPTTYNGMFLFRLCFVNPATKSEHVIRALMSLSD